MVPQIATTGARLASRARTNREAMAGACAPAIQSSVLQPTASRYPGRAPDAWLENGAKKRVSTISSQGSGRAVRRAATGAINRLRELVARSSKIVEQVRQRFAGEKIANRLVSLHDPDARPIRKRKLAQPTEFGYTVQYGELTSSTKKGARGLLLPPKLGVGSVSENILLEENAAEITGLEFGLVEASFDAGFTVKATAATMAEVGGEIFVAGSKKNAGSRHTRRRRASYRVAARVVSPISSASRRKALTTERRGGRSDLVQLDGTGLRPGHGFPAATQTAQVADLRTAQAVLPHHP